MLRKLFPILLASLIPSLLLAAEYEWIQVQNLERVDLSEVDASTVYLRQDYTGSISGYCGIELDSTIPMQTVLDAFSFDLQPIEVTSATAHFSFPTYRYVVILEVRTGSSATMKDVLAKLGTSLHARAVSCETEAENNMMALDSH